MGKMEESWKKKGQKNSSPGDRLSPALLFSLVLWTIGPGIVENYFFLGFVADGFFTTTSLPPTTIPITAPNAASRFNFWVLITKS